MSERLETAIADKREHPEHVWRDAKDRELYLTGDVVYSGYPPLDGWTLVEEHKLCPGCGHRAEEKESRIECRYCTFSANTWETWDRRVSGWHGMAERPPEIARYWCMDEDGDYHPIFWNGRTWEKGIGEGAIAWRDNDG